jgi:hypothetical protein
LLELLSHPLLRLQDLAQHVGIRCHESLISVVSGGGDRSPLPDAPKPLGLPHAGLNICKLSP